MKNTLFCGDNLKVLRAHIADESVDLVYLDPPFNSNRNYSVLFHDESGRYAETQVEAFGDVWHWGEEAEETYRDLVTQSEDEVVKAMKALRELVGTNQVMAYLVMMTARLTELRRVLRPTGSLYLHCDPTSSHYLKLVLDSILGPANFRNEIIWKRTHAHGSARRYGPVHDVILFYTKSNDFTWTHPRTEHSPEYLEKHFTYLDRETGRHFQPITLTGSGVRRGDSGKPWRGIDPTRVGRHWALPKAILARMDLPGETTQQKLDALDEAGMIYWPSKRGGTPRFKQYADSLQGPMLPDVWTDVSPLKARASERLGYPTQKPLALLERIVGASSRPGDTVLDPFCGCGTTLVAAERLDRRWMGIDITHLSVALQKYRLEATFPAIEFEVEGEPDDIEAARRLSLEDSAQFRHWALSLVRARPVGALEETNGASGADGRVEFADDDRGSRRSLLVRIETGRVDGARIRRFADLLSHEDAPLGAIVTLEEPTPDALEETADLGSYRSGGSGKEYPRIQLFTLAELLAGSELAVPKGADAARPHAGGRTRVTEDLRLDL